jgi:pimeloyl-ACP methyl ester carboxylesterase
MRHIQARGVRTHIAQWGAGDDTLLIHGASSDLGVFVPTVVPLLSPHMKLTAYDRPGMGLTVERPRDAERLEVQASIAAGVIDALELKRPVVIAHSYGGAVALRLALDHGDRIGGLVLIAPVAYSWPGGVSWHLHWSVNPLVGGLFNHLLTRPFVKAAARSGTVAAFAPSRMPDGYIEGAGVMRAVRPAAMYASARDVTNLKREVVAQQDRYPALSMPVAILVGDGDTVVSPVIHALRLAKTLPNARIEVLSGVGHLPHEARPEAVLKLVEWVRAAS